MSLYQISDELKNFEFQIDEETGEVLNLDEFEKLEMTWHDKIENCVLYIKNLSAEIKAINEEIKELEKRKKAKMNRKQWLQDYVMFNLDGKKFETPKCRVSYRRSKVAVIDDEDKLLMGWFGSPIVKHKEIDEVSKVELKKALLEGNQALETVAHIEEKVHIQIK